MSAVISFYRKVMSQLDGGSRDVFIKLYIDMQMRVCEGLRRERIGGIRFHWIIIDSISVRSDYHYAMGVTKACSVTGYI